MVGQSSSKGHPAATVSESLLSQACQMIWLSYVIKNLSGCHRDGARPNRWEDFSDACSSVSSCAEGSVMVTFATACLSAVNCTDNVSKLVTIGSPHNSLHSSS